MPKLPDELYITALNDNGEEKQSKKSDRFFQNNDAPISNNQQQQDKSSSNIFNLYSEEEIENFRCIFDMFDKDKSGFIEVADLQTIMRSLGRDPNEANDLLQGLDLNQDGRLSFEEFLRIMKNLENRLVNGKEEGEQSPREADLEERNKYGSLLPRTGVHFLPDSKVVDFLKQFTYYLKCNRLLNDYRKKCCREMNLTEAIRAQLKFDDLKSKETLRQMQNMRSAQEQELITVENAQRAQFLEFSQAWDNYMSDYEATAYLSLEKLKEKHILELQQLRDQIRKEFKIKLKFTKELMEMRKQVHVLIGLKRYEEAEALKNECDVKEEEERKQIETQIEEAIQKGEERLRAKQQMALAALLKRIQRDRNEQLKHRQIDSQRLIQRNKNLLLDLLNKQNMETRRTNQFLRFALGVRSPDKKNYYKSKLYTAPEDAKLRIGSSENNNNINKTMYNNKTNGSLVGIKNQQFQQTRAKTSKVGDIRSMSIENEGPEMKQKSQTRGAARLLNKSNMISAGSTQPTFLNNRGSLNGRSRVGEEQAFTANNQNSYKDVKLPLIKQ